MTRGGVCQPKMTRHGGVRQPKSADKLSSQCTECGKVFKLRSSLIVHLNKHKGKKYDCEICQKSYTASYSLLIHKRTHSGARPYSCRTCGATFTHSGHRLRHEKIHTAVTGKKSNRKRKTIKKEPQQQQDNGSSVFVCPLCHRIFSSARTLRTHKYLHLGRSYPCDKCDKRYTSRHALKQHRLIHADLRPFKCATCGASFRWRTNLARHSKLHTGERPIICDQCGKSFLDTGALTAHRQCHMPSSSVTCHVCGKTLKHKTYLRAHMKTHSSRKEFKCSKCGREFVHKHAYLTHTVRHSESADGIQKKGFFKPPSVFCNVCDKGFASKQGLNKHLKKHKDGSLKRFNTKPTGIVQNTIETNSTLNSNGMKRTVKVIHGLTEKVLKTVTSTCDTDIQVKIGDKRENKEEHGVLMKKKESNKVRRKENPKNVKTKSWKENGLINLLTEADCNPESNKSCMEKVANLMVVIEDDTDTLGVSELLIDSDAEVEAEDLTSQQRKEGEVYPDNVHAVKRSSKMHSDEEIIDNAVDMHESSEKPMVSGLMEVNKVTDNQAKKCDGSTIDCETKRLINLKNVNSDDGNFHMDENESILPVGDSGRLPQVANQTTACEQESDLESSNELNETSKHVNVQLTNKVNAIDPEIDWKNQTDSVGALSNSSDGPSLSVNRGTDLRCQFCNQAFNRGMTLRVHVRKNHPDKLKRVLRRCRLEHCGFSTYSSLHYARHQFGHKKQDPDATSKVGTQLLHNEAGSPHATKETYPLYHTKKAGSQQEVDGTGSKPIVEEAGPQLKIDVPGFKPIIKETGPQQKIKMTGPKPFEKETGPQQEVDVTGYKPMVKETGPQQEADETGSKTMLRGVGSHHMPQEDCSKCLGNEAGPLFMSKDADSKIINNETGPHLISSAAGCHQLALADSQYIMQDDGLKHNVNEAGTKHITIGAGILQTTRDASKKLDLYDGTVEEQSVRNDWNDDCNKHLTETEDSAEALSSNKVKNILSTCHLQNTPSADINAKQQSFEQLKEGQDLSEGIRCDHIEEPFESLSKDKESGNKAKSDAGIQCPECPETFMSTKNIRKHLRKDHKKVEYACLLCDKSFHTRSGLNRHKIHHVGNSSDIQTVRNFMCSVCGVCFTTAYSLSSHLARHTTAQPYECDKCGKHFSQLSHLSRHKVTFHEGVRRFSCDFSGCEKKFRDREALATHQRSHTGERPYQCDICSKRFVQLQTLKKHHQTHFDVRNFICHFCQQAFTTKNSLTRHLQRHEAAHKVDLQSTPYDMELKSSTSVKKMADKVVKCESCDSKFTTRRGLHAHKKKRCKGRLGGSAVIATDTSSTMDGRDMTFISSGAKLTIDLGGSNLSQNESVDYERHVAGLWTVDKDMLNATAFVGRTSLESMGRCLVVSETRTATDNVRRSSIVEHGSQVNKNLTYNNPTSLIATKSTTGSVQGTDYSGRNEMTEPTRSDWLQTREPV